jgi:intracellular septation protein
MFFMKLLIDFFPIILFFAAFKAWGIYAATAVAIVATIVQIAYLRFKTGKVETMQWVSLGVIVVFGGATLLAHDENFIKWKPTVLYWLMGGALLVGLVLFKKNFIKSLMGAQMQLPDSVCNNLNWAWTGFFAVMGVLNLWVAFNFDTDTWVNFKMFGGIGLMLAFVVGQALYLGRYLKEPEQNTATKDSSHE